MTLTKLLSNTGFCCCLLGISGIGGALDNGTSLAAPVALFLIGVMCFYFFVKEGGMHEEE